MSLKEHNIYKAEVEFDQDTLDQDNDRSIQLNIIYNAKDKKEAIRSVCRFIVGRLENLTFVTKVLAFKVYYYFINPISKEGDYKTGAINCFFEWKIDDYYDFKDIEQKIKKMI